MAFGQGHGGDIPAVQRVAALLRAIDPQATEAQVMHTYTQARTHPRKRNEDGREQAVNLKLLWAVMQRDGFLARRQRLAAPTAMATSGNNLGRGRGRERESGVVDLWMSLRPCLTR